MAGLENTWAVGGVAGVAGAGPSKIVKSAKPPVSQSEQIAVMTTVFVIVIKFRLFRRPPFNTVSDGLLDTTESIATAKVNDR